MSDIVLDPAVDNPPAGSGSLRDRFIGATDIETELVSLPWIDPDFKILVKSLTAKDRGLMMQQAAQADGTMLIAAIEVDLVILCSYDPTDGTRIFSEQDRASLEGKGARSVAAISDVAARVSHLTGERPDESAMETAGKG